MEYFMAKIVEDVLVVKFSKIVKDSENDKVVLANSEIQQALEQVAQELVGEGVIVEVMGAE
jgi:hypothetical protein